MDTSLPKNPPNAGNEHFEVYQAADNPDVATPIRANSDEPRTSRNAIRHVWNRLLRYWFDDAPPEATGLFRICWGLFSLASWLPYARDVRLYLSREGMAFPLFEQPDAVDSFSDLLGLIGQPAAFETACILYGATIASIVLFCIGWLARPALTVYVGLFGYWYLTQLHVRDTSFDRILFLISAYLVFAQSDAAFSVRAWLRSRSGMSPIALIPVWPARLIGFQVVFMYFGAGIYKVISGPWGMGEVLYYNLQGDWASPTAFWFVSCVTLIGFYDLMVIKVILLELYAPVFFWHPRLQTLALLGGVVFHIAIAVFLNIYPFLCMVLAYPLLMDPRTVAEACRRVVPVRSGDNPLPGRTS